MTTSDDLPRILWRSRRGMLELDLVLVPFAEHRYRTLDEAERRAYGALLQRDDWEILDWLQRRAVPDDEFVAIVERIQRGIKVDTGGGS